MRHRTATKHPLAIAALLAGLSLSAQPATSTVALAADVGAPTPLTPSSPAPAPSPSPSPDTSAAPAPIPAPAVTAEGAAQLAKRLDERLRVYLRSVADGAKVETAGPTMAMVDGDHYAVSLPVIRFEGGAKDTHLEVPGVTMTVKPLADEEFALTIRLPSGMTALEKGKPVATLTLGAHDISGVWSGPYENFLRLDASMEDLGLRVMEEELTFSVGAVQMTQDLKRDSDGVGRSGPIAMAVTDVRIEEEEEPIFTIGSLTWEGVYARVRMDRWAELTRMAEDNAEKGVAPDPAKFLSLIEGLFGGMSSRLRINDLTASNYDDDSDEGTEVTIGRLGLEGGIDGFDGEKAVLTFGYEVSGIGVDPAPVDDVMMPLGSELSVTLRDIPSKRLLGLAQSLLAPTADTPPPIPALMEILATAGLALEINRADVKMPLGGVGATGTVRANAEAAMGGEGEVVVRVRGLDAMIDRLRPVDGGKPDKETKEILGGLTMLKAMGRPEPAANGATDMVYAIKLTPQGTILLNGTDMAPLMGMQ